MKEIPCGKLMTGSKDQVGLAILYVLQVDKVSIPWAGVLKGILL